MQSTISQMRETLQRLERLLARFELDVACRLYPLDNSRAIAELCLEFEQQMQALTAYQDDECVERE